MKRELGKTGIQISAIGLGVWQFSEAQGFHKFIWKAIDPQERNAIVEATIKGGINWFDTAEMYGNGRSEKGLSQSLQDLGFKDEDVKIATKWNPILRTAKSIKKTFGKRVENLSPYSIMLHQVHNPASFSSIPKQMHAMADLLEEKKIGSVGVSNFNASRMKKSQSALEERGFHLSANQVRYSLADRGIESNGILDTAKEFKTTIIAYSPLEQGLLTGKFHSNPELFANVPFARKRILKRKYEKIRPLVDLLETIASEHSVTAGQVSLNWLVNYHGQTVVAIPGASKKRHAEQNAGAMDFSLSKEQMDSIEEASQIFL